MPTECVRASGARRALLSCALAGVLLPALAWPEDPPKPEAGLAAEGGKAGGASQIEADKKALAPFQRYVGSWKGSGAAKGNAAKEAWGEETEWRWDFKEGRAALLCSTTNGKFFSNGKLEPDVKSGQFLFITTLADGKGQESFRGGVNKAGDLELTAAKPAETGPTRITIGTVAKGKRLLVLYQRQDAGTSTYRPVAEVGLTRIGSGFGKDQTAQECIITGGLGTIAVAYKGHTYYVCCGGCKSTFLDDPEKELKAYRQRKAEEKAQEKK